MKAFINSLFLRILTLMGWKVVHFIHIGKTGGSAIRNSFSESSRLNKRQLLSRPFIYRMNGHGFTLLDAKPNELVFFVVREPISRFVSSFYSRQREGKPKNYNPWTSEEKIAFELFETPNALAEGLTSEDPFFRVEAEKAMKSINHVKNHYWDWFIDEDTLRKNSHRILAVLRQENLTNDFDAFRAKHNIKINSLPSDPVKRHKNPDSVDKKLSETAILNLKKWYGVDFQFIELLKEINLLPK